MKIPAAKTKTPAPDPIPAAYLAMAAAHMQSLGKPVFDQTAQPSAPLALKVPDAAGQ